MVSTKSSGGSGCLCASRFECKIDPGSHGLELYTVGKEMDADPFGTLKRVAAVGYKNVELSPIAKLPLADLQKGLDDVGLKNSAGHYLLPDLMTKLR